MKLSELFKDSHQITHIIILTGIALVMVMVSFGSYYYYDRYVDKSGYVSPIQQSITELEEALRKNPSDVNVRLSLAETYMASGRYESAIEQASQVYQADPENERALFVLGLALASTSQYDQAIEPLKKFASIREKGEMANVDSALETALYFLGESYLQESQPEKAIPVLVRALEINRTDADAMYKLGQVYAATGQHAEAIILYENAIRFVPDFAEVYQGMVESYLTLNQPTHAAYARGMLAYSIKDYEGARVELEQVVLTEPDFVPSYLGLGLTYERLGDYQTALAYAELALEMDPNSQAAFQLKGRIDTVLQK